MNFRIQVDIGNALVNGILDEAVKIRPEQFEEIMSVCDKWFKNRRLIRLAIDTELQTCEILECV